MWWLVVLASTALIVVGVGLLVKDVFKARGLAPKRAERGKASARTAKSPTAAASAAPPQEHEREDLSTATAPGRPRLQLLEHQWPQLRPEIEAAVASVNQSMASLSLIVGPPGEANWSLHNQGYGDYRRVQVAGESLGWLRLEVGADLAVTARLRAHDAERNAINRDVVAPARRVDSQLTQTVTECLKGAFDYAVWRHSNSVKNEAPPTTVRVQPHAPAQQVAPMQQGVPVQRTATVPAMYAAPIPAAMPSPAAAMIDASVTLVNKAFAEVGAELRSTDQRRGPTTAFADRALSVSVRGVAVALMLIEPRADRIDISVGVSDMANFQAARRVSQPMSGLTVHALAEAIATNAWPAIAAASSQAAVA